MAVDYLNEREKLIRELKEIFSNEGIYSLCSWDSLADFIEKDRKRVVEKVNIAYHAIRSHRSYGRNDSPHLERAEKALYEVMKLSRLGD